MHPSLKESQSNFLYLCSLAFSNLQSCEFFPSRVYNDKFLLRKAKYKLSLLRHTPTCIRSGGGREGERVSEWEATKLAACNTSHQPRLAGAKVPLYNKWYLTDTVFNVAVKGNVWMSLCECIYSVCKYTWSYIYKHMLAQEWAWILVYLHFLTFQQDTGWKSNCYKQAVFLCTLLPCISAKDFV